MTTVNAPCCLLSRNEFYRSISPTDKIKAVNSLSDNLMEPKEKQVTVWVTKSKHQDFSGHMMSPASSRNSLKHLRPADRVVK